MQGFRSKVEEMRIIPRKRRKEVEILRFIRRRRRWVRLAVCFEDNLGGIWFVGGCYYENNRVKYGFLLIFNFIKNKR